MDLHKFVLSAPAVRTVSYCEKFAQAPRNVQWSVNHWNNMLRAAGHSDVEKIGKGESLLYAVDWDGETVGAIVWYLTDENYWWISITHVDSRCRRQGIYKMLWDCLVYVAKEKGMKRIEGAIHVDNVVRLKTMEKLGQKAAYINFTYTVVGDHAKI